MYLCPYTKGCVLFCEPSELISQMGLLSMAGGMTGHPSVSDNAMYPPGFENTEGSSGVPMAYWAVWLGWLPGKWPAQEIATVLILIETSWGLMTYKWSLKAFNILLIWLRIVYPTFATSLEQLLNILCPWASALSAEMGLEARVHIVQVGTRSYTLFWRGYWGHFCSLRTKYIWSAFLDCWVDCFSNNIQEEYRGISGVCAELRHKLIGYMCESGALAARGCANFYYVHTASSSSLFDAAQDAKLCDCAPALDKTKLPSVLRQAVGWNRTQAHWWSDAWGYVHYNLRKGWGAVSKL